MKVSRKLKYWKFGRTDATKRTAERSGPAETDLSIMNRSSDPKWPAIQKQNVKTNADACDVAKREKKSAMAAVISIFPPDMSRSTGYVDQKDHPCANSLNHS